ncbi:choice-of-anchor J domain-containing protein [Vulgatibacter incomptus]|uniref:choice-of-anchor J domain-containing protein n=1 Tax=Vulgatibacter incomptus TaxID=1391653 RepID=UPI001470320F|nr:choice-of-anchor J domain-containing protein [Vulgatibacter incomptus]
MTQSCDEDGAWHDGVACEFGCRAGNCIGPSACELGTVRCQGRVPQRCGEDGWHEGAACEFACSEGQCTGVCVPESSRCDGLVPQRCSEVGAWVGGEACDFACSAGACTGSCVPGEHRCADGTTVETCGASGTWQRSACPQLCSDQTDACACAPGYEGDGTVCTPIDFCSAPNGGCSPRARCTQVGTTPSCACSGGTTGDGYSCTYEPTRIFDEGFDDITRLAPANWLLANRSDPRGTTSWFQGANVQALGPFDSFDGPPNSYIAANFNNTMFHDATISSWLATPTVPFGSRASISFYTRSSNLAPDRIEVRLCTALPCFLPDDADVGSYTTLLGSVNPTLEANGYPGVWTKFEFTNANGIPYSGEGRVAIRYYVTDAGHSGANSDYIGIDRFVVSFATPSYTVGGSVGGLTSGSVVLWLNGRDQLTVSANGSFRFPRRMDGGTPYSVRVYAQPDDKRCTVAGAAGTIGVADVGNVRVTCAPR